MSSERPLHNNVQPQIATLVPPQVSSDSGDGDRQYTTAFISDLHLLSSRCHYSRHEGAIRRAVEAAQVCVWGGDLFDFCWSCHGDGPQSREIAIEWLEQWRTEFPDKTFVYLTGNHDAQPEFQDALAEWAGSDPNRPLAVDGEHELTIQPQAVYVGLDAIRLGDCLMVHGDVIEAGGVDADLARYRSRWQHERRGIERPPRVRNQLYNAAVSARLHLATASVAHRRKNVCMRLVHWIHSQPDWVGDGVQRIVFGHTHRRLDGIRIADYQFYNTGAAVKHVPFDPVVLDVGVDWQRREQS